MAKPHPHIIKRQILELQGLRQEDANEMQERMRRLYHSRLLPLIDSYLSQLSPNGQAFHIEKLELDLGTINMLDFEAAIVEQLEKQLQAQLSQFSPPDTTAEEQSSSKPEKPGTRQWALFRYFIETGSLPWWAESQVADPVIESLDHLLENQPSLLIGGMHDWLPTEPYLRRLVRQLPPDRLVRIAGLTIQPANGIFHVQAQAFFQLVAPLAATLGLLAYRFQEEASLKLLQIAYSQTAATKGLSGFWQALLLQLSVAFRIKYSRLLESLQAILAEPSANAPSRPGLAAIVQQLIANQGLQSESTETNSLEAILKQPKQEQQKPFPFSGPIQAGALPALFQWLSEQEGISVVEQQSLLKAYRKWHQESSSGNLEVLGQTLEEVLNRDPSIRPRLTRKWASLLEAILVRPGLPARLQEKLTLQVQKLKDNIEGPPEITAILELLKEARMHGPSQQLSGATVNEIAPVPKPRNDTFSTTHELFIANAGLVILWPYLSRFFQSLGLLEGKQFIDVAAMHRAAGLLQYLANSQPESPEYLLAFNKILCGLPWDEVLDFGEPMTEAEAEECAVFIQAVIANAPVLKNMSADGFRGTFLLRKGMLRPIPEGWELHVEKETYDVVLDQFPWSWKVVKLPWLDEVVVVEW